MNTYAEQWCLFVNEMKYEGIEAEIADQMNEHEYVMDQMIQEIDGLPEANFYSSESQYLTFQYPKVMIWELDKRNLTINEFVMYVHSYMTIDENIAQWEKQVRDLSGYVTPQEIAITCVPNHPNQFEIEIVASGSYHECKFEYNGNCKNIILTESDDTINYHIGTKIGGAFNFYSMDTYKLMQKILLHKFNISSKRLVQQHDGYVITLNQNIVFVNFVMQFVFEGFYNWQIIKKVMIFK